MEIFAVKYILVFLFLCVAAVSVQGQCEGKTCTECKEDAENCVWGNCPDEEPICTELLLALDQCDGEAITPVETCEEEPTDTPSGTPPTQSPEAAEATPTQTPAAEVSPSQPPEGTTEAQEVTTAAVKETTEPSGTTAASEGQTTKPTEEETTVAGEETTVEPGETTQGLEGETTESTEPNAEPIISSASFDAASFVGGIILCGGFILVVFLGVKFYQSRNKNYHTL